MRLGDAGDVPTGVLASEVTRRNLLARSGMLAAGALVFSGEAARVAAEGTPAAGTPVAVDPEKLQKLTDLSQTLCGGGTFSSDRATKLYQIIFSDPALEAGFEQLLETPPVAGQSIAPDSAKTTAVAILEFWYADTLAGNPLPDRGTAYYQLTSWQAMYTFSWAVCHSFDAWSKEPADAPLVPANS